MTRSIARTSHGPSAHGDECPCTRCVGFLPANDTARRHGAYSTLRLPDREEELAQELMASAPVVGSCDGPVFRLLAAALARFERATQALSLVDGAAGSPLDVYMTPQASAVERIRHDQIRYMNAARKLCEDLGLAPAARLRMGLDAAHGEVLRRELVAKYGGTA